MGHFSLPAKALAPWLAASIISILLLMPGSRVFAQATQCREVFGKLQPIEVARDRLHDWLKQDPEVGHVVTIFDEVKVKFGRYESASVKDGAIYVTFREYAEEFGGERGDERRVRTFTAPLSRIQVRRSQGPRDGQLEGFELLRVAVRRVDQAAKEVAGLMYATADKVFETARITVYARNSKDAVPGVRAGRVIDRFDDYLAERGFRLPEHTLVFIDDRPDPSGRIGPFYLGSAVWSPLRGRSDATIKVIPFDGHEANSRDPSVLFHERMHSMLMRHYAARAFFNQPGGRALQEALADFVAAHFNGSPALGMGSTPVRDLERANSEARAGLPLTRALFRPEAPHDNSLAYSGILWRLRVRLGAERMDRQLKPLLDALAGTAGPFTSFISYGPIDVENANLRHFIGLLLDFYRHDPAATAVLREVAEANLFSPDELARSFAGSSGGSPLLNSSSSSRGGKGLMTWATLRYGAPAGAVGSVLYVLWTSFFDDE